MFKWSKVAMMVLGLLAVATPAMAQDAAAPLLGSAIGAGLIMLGASYGIGRIGSAAVESIAAVADPTLSEWVEDKVQTSDRPELTSAKIVVSGGRGVGSEESFAIIEALADKL